MSRWQRPDIKVPDDDFPFPSTLTKTRKIDDITFFAGVGSKDADIMFISNCPLEEELDDRYSPSALLKGGPANLFRRSALRVGINFDEQYYTTLCKFCLPRSNKLKPTAKQIKQNAKYLEDEIKKIKPKIIVCLGKSVFDYLFPIKFKEKEILGGWFKDKERNALLYLMHPIHLTLNKPEYLDKQIIDLKEVKREYDIINNVDLKEVNREYQHIEDYDELEKLLTKLKAENKTEFAIDCEWGGQFYLDGKIRSFQFCWEEGKAACVQFYNEFGKFCFKNKTFDEVKELLQKFFNRDCVKYIGHNYYTDAIWMNKVLGLETLNKCIFDTLFAMQTVDEFADVKLEKLAIRFCDYARYDIDLLIWKKKNKEQLDEDAGYGKVPTKLLSPYSMYDVDTTFRAYKELIKLLVKDNTLKYYYNFVLPFVTDGFYYMSLTGLPIDIDDIRLLTKQYHFVRDMMDTMFRRQLKKEAEQYFLIECLKVDPVLGITKHKEFLNNKFKDHILNDIKEYFGKEFFNSYDIINHWLNVESFNYNSSEQKVNWLFKVKKLTPVKTTKTDGMPGISWGKVEVLPKDEQKRYTPAVDKDTIKIYADSGDDTCQLLLELMSVATICKGFLKGDGEGIQKWIYSDGRVHTQFALTESHRPRCWKPNILNYTKFVATNIQSSFDKVKQWIIDNYATDNNKDINSSYLNFLDSLSDEEKENFPEEYSEPMPIRWCFKAPEGWCFTEADFATAEVFAIAYLSNDTNLIKALTEPDKQYALLKSSDPSKDPKPVRIAYIDENTNITDDKKDLSLLHDPNDPNLLRDEEGNLIHPKRDVHWEMAENKFFKNEPREKLSKDIDRGAGKVGNFSIPYQASPSLLNRNIEVLTGQKPPDETGENLIEAYKQGKPKVWEQLEEWMKLPEYPGYYQAPTGFKRHFPSLTDIDVKGISSYHKDRVLAPLRREAANIPLQSIVSGILSRACININREFDKLGMKARAVVPLYDALYVLHPISEQNEVKRLMQKHMSDENYVDLKGGQLRFNLDFEVTKRWACKPSAEEKEELSKYSENNNLTNR